MSKEKISLGNKGEELAANFLKDNGYKIICRNYKTKLGEIDIVAREKDTICFVEVKTRSSDKFGLGSEAVTRLKQRQVARVALSFLKGKSLLNKKARFDVISVDCSGTGKYKTLSHTTAKIVQSYRQRRFSCLPKVKLDLIKNAFELDGSFTY